jgi:hypothetical protein
VATVLVKRLALALALLAPVRGPLAAQALSADSLLALGRVAEAEFEYYAAVRARPRDPVTRAKLGSYLAKRGAVRVGTVLLEEARFFGGDSAVIARELVPWYARLGDWKAIAAMRPNVIGAVERALAEFLVARPSKVTFRDNASFLYRAPGLNDGFGTVLLRVGGAEVAVRIDPAGSGVVLPRSLRGRLTMVGDSLSVVGAASFRVGAVAFENIPVTLTAIDEAARIGFDVLAPYSPTFDPRAGQVTLHRPDRRWRPGPGTRVPALYDGAGIRMLYAGAWVPASATAATRLLGSRPWTWDARRGDFILLTP